MGYFSFGDRSITAHFCRNFFYEKGEHSIRRLKSGGGIMNDSKNNSHFHARFGMHESHRAPPTKNKANK